MSVIPYFCPVRPIGFACFWGFEDGGIFVLGHAGFTKKLIFSIVVFIFDFI